MFAAPNPTANHTPSCCLARNATDPGTTVRNNELDSSLPLLTPSAIIGCHIPPVQDAELISRLKASNANDLDNGLDAWVCKRCSKRKPESTTVVRNSVLPPHHPDSRPAIAPSKPTCIPEIVEVSPPRPPAPRKNAAADPFDIPPCRDDIVLVDTPRVNTRTQPTPPLQVNSLHPTARQRMLIICAYHTSPPYLCMIEMLLQPRMLPIIPHLIRTTTTK